ncbi:NAD(P)H-binding protein [Sulfobacillus harzensis]|uniref:NAD(P)H-binding protein n=1 Tax=Sulfobacillus harzensis TaxID=2729629 RepID=A0A7Y0L3M1_9FIRM|nr:NAD(P)H-binding protein [Sulfobacillus harzensis]NMP22707.1 NAD(P)H-binding protein [Sulfobacillus harzensis]
MRKFAFIIHPLRFDDFARKYPITQHLPPKLVEWAFKQVGPVTAGHVTGVHSPTGEELEGWLLGLPLTPDILLNAPYEWVLKKLTASVQLAEKLGAEIVGLGAFTKIAGDRGITLSQRVGVPITTGNSYTTATAVQGTLMAAERMQIDLGQARATVIGATGSIGRAATFLLAEQVRQVTLVSRTEEDLKALAAEIRARHPAIKVDWTTHIPEAVRPADIVVAVSSATGTIVEPDDLKPGAVVTDVARPRNLSRVVMEQRHDVLVLDGGVIQVPGENADMGFDFGFPPKMVEACMAETMILALEGRLECFTLGPTIDVARVQEIRELGDKHGFSLAGFRRFERAIDDSEIERIRLAARSASA